MFHVHSSSDVLETFVIHSNSLHRKAFENNLARDIKEKISSAKFKSDVEYERTIMKPLQDFLDDLINENYCLAEATEAYLQMKTKLSPEAKRRLLFFEFCDPPALLANAFHPKFKGNLFSHNQNELLNNMLLDILDKKDLEGFVSYRDNLNSFGRKELQDLTLATYWSFFKKTHGTLSETALHYSSLPSTTFCLREKSNVTTELSRTQKEKIDFIKQAARM